MDSLFVPIFILISVFILVFILLTLYLFWHEDNQRKKEIDYKAKLLIDEAEEQKNSIVHTALSDANKLLIDAELTGIKTVAERKVAVDKYEKAFETDLKTMASAAVNGVITATTTLTKRYEQFVAESENIIAHHLSQNQKVLDQQYQAIIDKNDQALESFFQLQKQEIKNTIESSVQETRDLLKTYREKRQQLIDEHIVELVEKATLLSLKKTLSPADHADLVLQSLEEAKTEGIFSKPQD